MITGAVAVFARRLALSGPSRVQSLAPTSNYTATTGAKTSAAFTVAVGDLIVVFGDAADANNLLNTPTASGGSVTWTLRQSWVEAADQVALYAWTGAVGAAGSITVSVTATNPTYNVWGWTGSLYRNHGGVGASSRSQGLGAPAVPIGAAAHSAVEVAIGDYNAVSGSGRVWNTVDGSPLVEAAYVAATGLTHYQGYDADTSVAANFTLGLTAPNGQRYSTVAVEILGIGVNTVQVTTTRSTAWTVRTRTAATRATPWAVAASTGGPPTATRATTWKVAARAATLRTVSWKIASTAPTTTRTTTWSVGGKPTATRATSWAVTAQPIATRIIGTWTVARLGTPTSSAGVRLRVFGPVGANLGILPSPMTVQSALPFCDVPSMKFDYHPRAAKAELLGQPCEIALEVTPDAGVSWVEPPNGRFVYSQDSLDELDPKDVISVDAQGYVSRLRKARVLPAANAPRPDGKRAFLSATPGLILKTLMNEAQARFSLDGQPALKGIGHSSWSATRDSNGVAWSQILTIYYTPGLDYLTILLDLVDQGFVEFEMRGRDLFLFNFETLANDRTTGTNPVTLRAGRDLREASRKRSWDALADYVLVVGDQGNYYETRNALAATPWGRQEVSRSDGRVLDQATMAVLGQSELAERQQVRSEFTRTLDFVRATSLPFFQYSNGDWVWSTVTGGLPDRFRVRQITMLQDSDGRMSGSVVLNDRFLEQEVRAARRINGITNGASGNAPNPDKPPSNRDAVAPGPPTNLLVSSTPVLGPGGYVVSQAFLDWEPPAFNVDGTPCTDIDYYEVFHRAYGTNPGTLIQVGVAADSFIGSLAAYPEGSNWIFAVRTVDLSGNRSAMGTEFTHAMAVDNNPPQAPTTPTVTTRLGTVVVRWDGLPATGTWPRNFDRVEVHASTTSQFTPDATTYQGDMFAAGVWVITDQAYGIPLYVRLVAVNTSKLKSSPSGQGTATPLRLVGSDIDPDAITFAQFAYKDVGSYIPDGSFESDTYRTALAARSSSAWTFTQAQAYHGSWSATIDAGTGAGTIRRLELEPALHPVQAGEKRFVRMAYQGTAGADGSLRLVVEWLNTTDTLIQASSVEGVVKNGSWQEIAGQLVAPVGSKSMRVHAALDAAGTVGTYWVDAVEVRETVSRAFIEDLAVNRALIDNLAVNDAKIANVEVGKLTAGTISADMILAGRFRTATSGNRVEFDATGIRMYAGDTLMGNWLTSAGQLRIYNSTDASHTSTGHGIQFGDSNGQNLILDNNEILSRFNGTYGSLFINREGGPVLIGGRIGGFPTDTDTGVFPADANHQVTMRAGVAIYNVSDGEYADEFPPLLIGRPGGSHLWFDSNEIGATAASGDAVGTLYLQGNRNTGDPYHNETISMASNSLGVRRYGSAGGGTFSTLLYGRDSGNNVGIRLSGTQDCVFITSAGATGYKAIKASSFDVNSSRTNKRDVTPVEGALSKVRAAPSTKWRYQPNMESSGRWHVGPMIEDLPEDVVMRGPVDAVDRADRDDHVSVPSLVGLLWEAVRQLADRVDALDVKGPKP